MIPDLGSVDSDAFLDMTLALVGITSPTGSEQAIADAVQARLEARAIGAEIIRFGNTVVVRNSRGGSQRVLIGGHLDTVAPEPGLDPRRDGVTIHGRGSADMKGGLSVMLRLAEHLDSMTTDVTLVFYEGEEGPDAGNGLKHLFAGRGDLVACDLAILMEPTDCRVEAGCQGTIHALATFKGTRAHTARPWMGANAIHLAAPMIARLAAFEAGTQEIDGLVYRESLQITAVNGGVARNVVPDECRIQVNRRFAPTRNMSDAVEEIELLLEGADLVEILETSPAAPPNLTNPLVSRFVDLVREPAHPKLGWTDVSRFAARGIPALNFGPGDPELAHTPIEHVTGRSISDAYEILLKFLRGLG